MILSQPSYSIDGYLEIQPSTLDLFYYTGEGPIQVPFE